MVHCISNIRWRNLRRGTLVKTFVVEEPKLEFKKPVFKKSINLPKASSNPIAKRYLENRKINPDKFYYADRFKSWTNTQKKHLTP